MIKSFKCKDMAALYDGERVRRFQAFAAVALRKLDSAVEIRDLAFPPGNRLQKLQGTETWSLRINRQWRICFTWPLDGAEDVEIIDYH
ncbi:MAG: type II toxin-antitoxin system RelE/ParE family toxin [Proteobacteria bacterium]|nr:type II toxin-antitoxin system RelE/ParE family toxin [Pseudomonadota bacterium]